MKRVSVLMSTYNGENYLKEQIESVLAQKNVDVHLVVRDDGSSDSTKDILKFYQDQNNITVIYGENIGWRRSFMELVYNAPISDYYAFCDQDDIWFHEKLNVAVDALDKYNLHDTPLLYGSNLYYYKDGIIGEKLNLNPNFTKHSSLIRTFTCGCTMVFNNALITLLRQYRPHYIEAHDSWIFIVALFMGRVIYDPNAYILYRQHEANQIGAKQSIIERYRRGMATIKNLGREQGKRKTAEEFYNLFHDMLDENDRRIVLKFSSYNKSFTLKLRLLLDNRYNIGGGISELFLKLKILTNTI